MKQLISVRAIIRDSQKTLLLRRSSGRQSILGKYELPGGKLGYGEQPEDALRRLLKEQAGVTVQSAQLYDVLTYIDHDDRDCQYTFILYLVSLSSSGGKIHLGAKYDEYRWKKLGEVAQDTLTESAKLLLGISQQQVTTLEKNVPIDNPIEYSGEPADTSQLIIYSDGGSRGNPGPSASGYVIMNLQHDVIHQGGVYLGITTNNQAEYHGVRLGLEKALEIGAKSVDFRIDSMLVVNQLNGIYTIKNRDLWPINERVKELAAQFDKISFSHVKREFNQLADGMVNKILNAHEKDAKKIHTNG
jgi:ribonuclease HI